MQLEFRGLTESEPGAAWRKVVDHGWPGWGAWFRAKGGPSGPSLEDSRRAVRRHMPEMETLLERLSGAVPGDEDFARFLTFWTPPRYLVSCSQIVLDDDEGPMLLRNYDLDPNLNESTMLHSAWRGRRVMGMVEGLAGLADGMNEAGLAASLTFGGRPNSGRGFGIPLIIRYVLETCRDAADAREALRAVPCHMSYNVTVADRGGDWATVFLAPDRPAIVSDQPLATNHQLGVEWPRHGRETRTEIREEHLQAMLDRKPGLSGAEARRDFLRAPLFSTGYARGFGTVYTASYRPASGEARLSWKDGGDLRWSIADFAPSEMQVTYSETGSRAAPAAPARARPHVVKAAPAQAIRPQDIPRARSGTIDQTLAAFFGELSGCLAGRRDWASLGTFWSRAARPATPNGDPS